MQGIDIVRAYWEQHGLPMLRESFPGLLPLAAAGLTGPGSECFGFDDELSRDHDFEPGFCLFIPGEGCSGQGNISRKSWARRTAY